MPRLVVNTTSPAYQQALAANDQINNYLRDDVNALLQLIRLGRIEQAKQSLLRHPLLRNRVMQAVRLAERIGSHVDLE